jgi:Yippee zinc-binding/DNA-binding /Mis18, centromere assembly
MARYPRLTIFVPSSGRAYLFDNCVNVRIGPAEDRRLMTGLHSVCDIFCIRCETMVGWTYTRAYEHSQKYKEGKFVIEKINLHLEESDYFDVAPPAGERNDRFRARSISWGNEESCISHRQDMVYEYHPHEIIGSWENRLAESSKL